MVFEGANTQHHKYAPVLNWVLKGKGRMIYGGTKYNAELAKMPGRIFGIVAELSKARRTIQLPNETVDAIAAQLKIRFIDPDFNDEHIVALVNASRCCVVCTNDNGAITYLKQADVAPSRPKIYRGHKSHKKLCCDKNLVQICLDQA
jgi:hypothetical protein